MTESADVAETAAPVAASEQSPQSVVRRSALAVAGTAGLVYWFTGWVSFPDGPTMTTASAQDIRDHVSTMGGDIQGATIAAVVGIAASIMFLAAIVRQIRDRLPSSLLADVVLGAGVLFIGYQWLMVTAEGLMVLLPKLLDSAQLSDYNDQTVMTWYALTGFTHFMGDLAMVPTVMIVGGFSLAARRGALLPKWLVWVGFGIAAVGTVGMVAVLGQMPTLYPAWFVGLIGYFMWVLAVSIVFLLRLRKSRRTSKAG